MEYIYNKEKVMSQIKREIARVASSSAGEDGSSLYDGIIYSSRDEGILDNYVERAKLGLTMRLNDVTTGTQTGFSFNVPDFDEMNGAMLSNAIDDYLMNNVVASWLLEKGSPKSEVYATLSEGSMDKVAKLLKTRRKPTRL